MASRTVDDDEDEDDDLDFHFSKPTPTAFSSISRTKSSGADAPTVPPISLARPNRSPSPAVILTALASYASVLIQLRCYLHRFVY
jgi:hypothetical protein